MKARRIQIFIILLLLTCFGFAFRYDTRGKNQWVIDKNCSLNVSGKTNINTFNCTVSNYSNTDTLSYLINSTGSLKLKGSISLDIENFNCQEKLMTHDLRKALQYKKFPKMTIRFISLSRYPSFNENAETLYGVVSIELAGVTKHFEIKYIFNKTGTATAKMVGEQNIYFSDFKIIPPKKLNGIIKAANELHVKFVMGIRLI